MFPALLFAISVVALAQFGVYYWRAVLSGVASQAVSIRVLDAIQTTEARLSGGDFEKLATLMKLTPELKSEHRGLGLVPASFRLIGKIGEALGQLSPALLSWTEHERLLCARYAAVQIELRLEANLAQAASMRSC